MSAERLGDAAVDTTVVDDFVAAWDSAAHPPDLASFLPDAATIRRTALLELIRVDLQHRWLRAGTRKRLYDYCAEFPELQVATLPAGLIYEEFVIRRHSGDPVDAQDYLDEFPAQADQLRHLLITDDDPSTQLAVTFDEPTAYADESTELAIGSYTGDTTALAAADDAEGADDADEATALHLDDTAYTQENTAYAQDNTAYAQDNTAFDGTRTAVAHEDDGTRTAMSADSSMTFAGGDDSRTAADSSTTAPLDDIEVGQRVDDFDLLTTLGSGAFARVFLARQRSMQRLVAVKISADHGNEPQTLAQLDHDYIVRIFDQRRLSRRGLKLLYMQFLPGGTLLSVLKWVRATPVTERNGQLLLDAVDAAMEEKGEIRPTDSSVRAEIATLTWPETVAWLGQRLAEALEYAGSHGVLHRDVKPANVLLTAEGVPKLADFNISFSRNVTGASPLAYFGGSLSYMSPEQLAACHPDKAGGAADLDTRSDIYSLGVVLWELLTGKKPFGSEGVSRGANASLGGDTTTLDAMIERREVGLPEEAFDDLPADCPATLRRVLATCMEPDREDRWSTGTELAQQLDLCLDPRARNLVDPPPHSWRLRLRRWIVTIVALSMGIPNILASVYNIHHNQTLIISRLSDQAQLQFGIITQIINLTFFPAGAAIIIYLCRYVLIVPRGLREGKTFDAETIARARRDALRMGDRVVVVAFSAWVLAGVTFPITLRVVSGSLPTDAYVHFIASLIVCGAIAVAYPFFLVNFYVVRCVYPAFLPFGDTGPGDVRQLQGLDRRCNLYLALAASVPLLGVAGVTFIDPVDIPKVIFAVRVLCVGAIIAFVFAYWLFRLLEEDLRALQRVVAHGSDTSVTAAG